MEITWLGHSCFRIKSGQTVIITDPFPPDLGYSLGKQQARIVTVSHDHPSHAYAEGVGGEPKVVNSPGEYEIGGVLIMGLSSFHDDQHGAQRGKNTIFVMEIDGMSLCHVGDIGHILTSSQAEEIEEVDVLLLPVGGVTTIDAAVASELIRLIDPKVVIPMHYGTPVTPGLNPVQNFLREMGREQITSQPKLTISKSGLPLSTQIYLLEYKGAETAG